MDLGFHSRVAVVTGGSRGIGRATAKLLAQEGAIVAVTYHSDGATADSLVREIQDQGNQACAVQLHLESEDSIYGALRRISETYGRIDILVNNAFATKVSQDSRTSRHFWPALYYYNTQGPYHVIEAAVPSMRANRWGRIVNVSSVLAVDGIPGFAWYAAAKSALHGLTRSLSKELGPFGILTNVVMPGYTLTEQQPLRVSTRNLKQAAAQLPLRRFPTPEEVAQVIVFLASSANSVITGEIVRASGG